MTTTELTKKVQELKEIKAMTEELQAEITAIEDEIKAEMTAQSVDELRAGVFKIRWTKVISNRFDTTAFKAKYQELYSQFTKATESKRFSIV